MENLEKVELIREKCGVTYEEAKKALEACDYDVLEAIIAIEKAGIEERAAEIEEVFEEPAKAAEPEVAEVEAESKAAEPEVTEAEAAAAEPEDADAYEVADAPKAEENGSQQNAYNAEPRSSNVAAAWSRFCGRCKDLTRASLDTMFVAERNGETVIAIPVLFVIIGLLVWGAALWLLVIGLFFGFRYRIEGKGMVVSGINEAMGKAADAADDVKQNLA